MTPEQIKRALDETAGSLPILPLLKALFIDPKMFNSFDRLSSAGFSLIDRGEEKLLSGSHSAAPDYFFKKYSNDTPGDRQLENYMRRLEGARLLRTFIAERGFQHVVTPKKWLHELPSGFPARYMIVAERLYPVSKNEAVRNYERIDKAQTRELATILYYFRGLNSTVSNLPFTENGKIAFIDTERWNRDREYLRLVGDRLPSKRLKLAEDVYRELRRHGARPFQSAL